MVNGQQCNGPSMVHPRSVVWPCHASIDLDEHRCDEDGNNWYVQVKGQNHDFNIGISSLIRTHPMHHGLAPLNVEGKQWAIGSTARSFACFTLLDLLTRSTALTRWLARSLTLELVGKCDILMSQNWDVLNQSVMAVKR